MIFREFYTYCDVIIRHEGLIVLKKRKICDVEFRDHICGRQMNIFSNFFMNMIDTEERNYHTEVYSYISNITCFIND